MNEPLAVIGLPMYGVAPHARQALLSLLGQSCDTFAIVIADDGGADRHELADLLADQRVTYTQNERRLGLTGNWRLVYELARARHPTAPYFAWASDHDVWHRDWLARLAAELDGAPQAVLAYGSRAVLSPDDEVRTRRWRFETRAVSDPRKRLAEVTRGMAAGYMIYGLFRSAIPATCGIFRPVMMPDRLLLSEASTLGAFHQVEESLWYRRKDVYSVARQRAALFPGHVPVTARIPWWLSHTAVFAIVQLGSERARRQRLSLTATHWASTVTFLLSRRVRAARRFVTRHLLRLRGM